MPKIAIIIPCFNEASNVAVLKCALDKVLTEHEVSCLFVDDGSVDGTLDEIKQLAAADKRVHYLSFSRNFGHQNAIKAGIDFADANADCLITIDADLQQHPEVIGEMLEKWQQGHEVVYAVKEKQKHLPFLKKATATLYNKLFYFLSDARHNALGSDFRLIDKKVADILRRDFHEYHLFYRGIVGWMGFNQCAVYYTPGRRYAGTTKYPYKKMCNLAVDGITSFSVKPLRMVTVVGLAISLCAFVYALYALYITFFSVHAITGWASVILSILFIGGLQLLFLGIIGEYLGKMFFEIKKRPHYILKDKKVS